MTKPKFEKGLTKALSEAIAAYQSYAPRLSMTIRMGTMTLPTGEEAQIHLTLTTSPDDFIDGALEEPRVARARHDDNPAACFRDDDK